MVRIFVLSALFAVAAAGCDDAANNGGGGDGGAGSGGSDMSAGNGGPAVTALSPAAGPVAGGNSLTITGSGFSGATAVHFGSAAASNLNVASDTSLIVAAPAGSSAGPVDVTVTTKKGTSAVVAADQYLYQPAPTLSAFTPTVGVVGGGTSVVITGSAFIGTTAVRFNGVVAMPFTVDSDTQITATSPNSGTGPIEVDAAGGMITSTDSFTYLAVPSVLMVAPAKGPMAGGTVVTVTGTGFVQIMGVKFGTTSAESYTVDSSTQITVTAPMNAVMGTVDVFVTNVVGTSPQYTYDTFTYAPPPTVTSVVPNVGPVAGGPRVQLAGTGLLGTTAVTFGGVAAMSFTVDSDTNMRAFSPPGAATGTVDVRVNSFGGLSPTNVDDQFTYQ